MPDNVETCGDVYEPDNGEFVSPCDLPKGHSGQCKGYCLGSRATWCREGVEPDFAPICGNCLHWGDPEQRTSGGITGCTFSAETGIYRTCQAITHDDDEHSHERFDHSHERYNVQPTPESDSWRAEHPAATSDYEGCGSMLITRAEFGCTLFSPKES